MSLALGSVTVGLTATPIPINLNSPGSVVLVWTGANPLTLGGPAVVAGQAQAGQAVLPANSVVPLAKVGAIVQGQLNGITVTATGVLSWLAGTEINT